MTLTSKGQGPSRSRFARSSDWRPGTRVVFDVVGDSVRNPESDAPGQRRGARRENARGGEARRPSSAQHRRNHGAHARRVKWRPPWWTAT